MTQDMPSGFLHTLNELQEQALGELWKKCENDSPETFEFLRSENSNPEGNLAVFL